MAFDLNWKEQKKKSKMKFRYCNVPHSQKPSAIWTIFDVFQILLSFNNWRSLHLLFLCYYSRYTNTVGKWTIIIIHPYKKNVAHPHFYDINRKNSIHTIVFHRHHQQLIVVSHTYWYYTSNTYFTSSYNVSYF